MRIIEDLARNPDADNTRTLLVKPVHPFDATLDGLHGNPDKARGRKAIGKAVKPLQGRACGGSVKLVLIDGGIL